MRAGGGAALSHIKSRSVGEDNQDSNSTTGCPRGPRRSSRSSGPSAPSGSRESFRRQTHSRMCSAQGTCFMLGPFRMGRLLGETWSKTRLLWRKLGSAVFPCNKYVYLGKVGIITEPLLMKSIQSQVISVGDKPDLLPPFCLISQANGAYAKRDGGSTCHICGNTIFEGLVYADIQKPEAGKYVPAAHRTRCSRRNSPDWWQHQ